MADFRLVHRAAVSAEFNSRIGAISLRALPEGLVIHVLGKPGDEDLAGPIEEIVGASRTVRAAGPGQWFVVGDDTVTNAELQALFTGLAPHAFGVDQSHGRVRIAIEGAASARALAKGTGVDLDALAVGQSAMTLIGHISVHLTRTAPDGFELMVLRGFAESLWGDLVRMGAEFG
jgi:sarcosine oxidase, subunit gamma